MKHLTFLILIASTYLFLSCSGGSSSTSPVTVFDILPLTSGNYWTYNAYLGIDTVNRHAVDSAVVGTSRTLQQILCYPLTTWQSVNGGAMTQYPTYYLFNRTDGLHSFVDTTSSTGTVLSVKYPVSVGDSWDVGNFAHMTCQSLTDSISTPAGTFTDCMRSRSSYSNSTSYSIVWHKPGVGEIRQEFYNTLGTLDSMRALRAYHIY